MSKKIYIIRTKSRLLAEFSQCPEGMGKIILVATLPFWAISVITRKCMERKNK